MGKVIHMTSPYTRALDPFARADNLRRAGAHQRLAHEAPPPKIVHAGARPPKIVHALIEQR
jgi:hypothetical protein